MDHARMAVCPTVTQTEQCRIDPLRSWVESAKESVVAVPTVRRLGYGKNTPKQAYAFME
jgi:hypothetical protein